jgi:hypothetical protein
MPGDSLGYLEIARGHWRDGQALEAGRLIFENLPPETRPKWAAGVLRLVIEKAGVAKSQFERTLYTADHPRKWACGHRCFDSLRRKVLKFDELQRSGRLSKDDELVHHVLLLAELVAKVTYNAADPPDPFDEDSGWWLAPGLKGFVDHWWPDDQRFSEAAWSALSSTI